MVYTRKEVIQYVNEEDVKFIRLAFCDAFGNQKNISVMPSELERAFESGIGIDVSSRDFRIRRRGVFGFGFVPRPVNTCCVAVATRSWSGCKNVL